MSQELVSYLVMWPGMAGAAALLAAPRALSLRKVILAAAQRQRVAGQPARADTPDSSRPVAAATSLPALHQANGNSTFRFVYDLLGYHEQ